MTDFSSTPFRGPTICFGGLDPCQYRHPASAHGHILSSGNQHPRCNFIRWNLNHALDNLPWLACGAPMTAKLAAMRWCPINSPEAPLKRHRSSLLEQPARTRGAAAVCLAVLDGGSSLHGGPLYASKSKAFVSVHNNTPRPPAGRSSFCPTPGAGNSWWPPRAGRCLSRWR